MVGQKFFVYGGGRWREVNLSTGRVAGWGVVQYLSVKRGRLELARKNAVLRGLKALAAGKPTSVQDGPQLSQIRNVTTKSIEEPKSVSNECQHRQHCCQRNIHCNTDGNFNKILKPTTSTVAVQCTITSKSTKVKETIDINDINNVHIKNKKSKKSNNNSGKRKRATSDSSDAFNSTDSQKNNSVGKFNTSLGQKNKKKSGKRNDKSAKRKRVSSDTSDVSNTTDTQKHASVVKLNKQLGQRVKLSQKQEPAKELFISEEDILLIRSFIENDDNNVFGVDLERFDSDDLYKCRVFYKLNPLVNVERCKRIPEFIRRQSALTDSFRDFIKNLGLQSVEEASQASSKKYRTRSRRKRVITVSSDKEFDKENINKEVNMKRRTRSKGVLGVKQSSVISDTKSGRLKSSTGLVKGSKARPASRKRNDLTERVLDKQNDLEKNKDAKNESVKKVEATKKNGNKKNSEQIKNNEQSKQNDSIKRNKHDGENKKSIEKNKMENHTGKKDTVKVKRYETLKVSDEQISSELNNKETLNDSDTMVENSDSDDGKSDKREKAKMPRLAVVPMKRLYIRGSSVRQPYSTSEDQVLVQWVRGSGRARLVNGNKIWLELQPIFHNKIGRFRSWHSLRNRYLRYLLPTLGTMPIPPDEAVRLRAAAAAGGIKSKKTLLNNSLYKEKRVISAWSRRPRSPLRKTPSPTLTLGHSSPHSSNNRSSIGRNELDCSAESVESEAMKRYRRMDVKGVKSKRELRSSAIGTSPKRDKQKQTNPRTPTYSELTKRFALKHSTPDSDSTGHNNTDKNDRPTRFNRKDTTDRQDEETSDDETKNKRHNLNNSKKRARPSSNDRHVADGDDRRKSISSHLNNSKKRPRQVSIDRQVDANDDQTKNKQQNLKKQNLNLSKSQKISIYTDNADSDDQNDKEHSRNNQRKTKSTNNVNNRRSVRKISTDRQDTDTDHQSNIRKLRTHQTSKNKNDQNNRRKRQRESSSENDTDTSDVEEQIKHKNKTNNSNKSPNKSSNNRQTADSSDDEANKRKSKSPRKSVRHNNKNNSINNNKQNNVNKNKRKSNNFRNDSIDSSDFEHDVKQVKILRSSSKADTDRPKTRRLYNPKAF